MPAASLRAIVDVGDPEQQTGFWISGSWDVPLTVEPGQYDLTIELGTWTLNLQLVTDYEAAENGFLSVNLIDNETFAEFTALAAAPLAIAGMPYDSGEQPVRPFLGTPQGTIRALS